MQSYFASTGSQEMRCQTTRQVSESRALIASGKIMQEHFSRLFLRIISCFLIAVYAFAVPAATATVIFKADCREGRELDLPVCKWENTVARGSAEQGISNSSSTEQGISNSSSTASEISNRGTVLLIHGITQRAYSLNSLATQLAEEGFTVYGIDQRGHGRWHFQATKKDPGYKCDFKQTVRDVDALIPVLRQANPEQPLFLVGESAGAGVAIRSAGDNPDLVRGVVLAGTGCKTGHVKLSWLLRDLLSNFYRIDHQINVVRYQKRYGTDDLPALEESLKDKWQRPTMSAREMFRAAKFMKKNAKFARRISPDTSVLVIQGCDDKVLKPKSARRVLANIPSRDKRLINIDKCGHILLGTNHLKPAVINSITAWLEHGLGQTTVASLDGVVTH